MKPRHLIIVLLNAALSACASAPALPMPAHLVTEAAYRDPTKGFVVLSVVWAPQRNCAAFDYAQLRAIGFDRMPIRVATVGLPADLRIEGSRWSAELGPAHYVLAVEPGEYALADFLIKLGISMDDADDVVYHAIGRAILYRDDRPIGGTFTVDAGELVYIGHFGVDCDQHPTIWRYYVKGPEEFDAYRRTIKARYRYVDVAAMRYRLFETSAFGVDYRPENTAD